MKVSLNTVKEYIDFELPETGELVECINRQLGGVEEVIELAAKYKGIVVAQVVSCEKHPDADRLRICKLDDGGVVEGVERDEDGYVQVVCGAPNAREGIFVAWLPPSVTVPASFNDQEPFVLSARKLRGVVSNGMLASPAELAISDNHDGILEITDADLRKVVHDDGRRTLKPGLDFAQTFGLDDTIIDIENKMFTHRPDCFGQLGVAREISGILGHAFTSPVWYASLPVFAEIDAASSLQLTTFNDAEQKVPRLMFAVMKNVSVAPSPLWLQCALVALGSRPISNIVDITNYIMLLTAQPTHAYDYDKLRGSRIGARMARDGESLKLLNGKTYTLFSDDIVIADAEGPIALGGIMGGADSEVSSETNNIVLEVATFDMYTVRKSSMRHGVFTDALTRFNKGQSPLQNDKIMSSMVLLIETSTGASLASAVFDIKDESLQVKQHDTRVILGDGRANDMSVFNWGSVSGVIVIDNAFVNARLGLNLSSDDIFSILRTVEVRANLEPTSVSAKYLEVIPPFWRTDLELPEDIVEEVGRLYGFDKLPRELPRRSIAPAPENPLQLAKMKTGRLLASAGANEVKTYSFIHERLLKAAGQDLSLAYQLGNALSPDLQYYRISLTPSLLAHVHSNIKAGYDEFALFEFGKGHCKGELDEEGLPKEFGRLAFVYAAKKSRQGAAYYQARRYVDLLQTGLEYVPIADSGYVEHKAFSQLLRPFESTRSAVIMNGDQLVGVVGEYTESTRRALKLPDYVAGFEIFQSFLPKRRGVTYTALTKFPYVFQDISLKVSKNTPFADIYGLAEAALEALRTECPEPLLLELSLRDIYAPQETNDVETKTVTLRLKAASRVRTLTDQEVSGYLERIHKAIVTAGLNV